MSTVSNMQADPRNPKAYVSTIATNLLHLRNPIITALWSVIFPGVGHIIIGNYIKGFLLFGWEMLINTQSQLNLVILYTFTGRFEEAQAVADIRWLISYIGVFLYAIWDSYRSTVDLNKYTILAERAGAPIKRFKMDSFEINYFDKRSPWVAVFWSVITPGLGHLYTHRLPTGFFVLIWWIIIMYQSHLLEVVEYTALGNSSHAIMVSNPEWLLFMPSIYCFALYDAYVNTVEFNKLFDAEQANFLKREYQSPNYLMPFCESGGQSMYIIASFEQSMFLELAISDLEIRGIPKKQIFATTLEKKRLQMHIIDTIHRADGVSTLDTAFIVGAFLAVLGAIYGYVWTGGPLLWGILGLLLGSLIGGTCDYMIVKKDRQRNGPNKSGEVILIVNCEKNQLSWIEEILSQHLALGLTKVDI